MGRGPKGRARQNAPYSPWWLCKGTAPGSGQIRSYSSPLVLRCRLAVQLDLDKDWSVGARGVGRRRVPYSRGRTATQPGQAGGPRGVIRCSFVLQGLRGPRRLGPRSGRRGCGESRVGSWRRPAPGRLRAHKSRPVRAVAARARVNSAWCSARPPSHSRKTATARLLRTGAAGGKLLPDEGTLQPSAGRAGVTIETLYLLRRPVQAPVRKARILEPASALTSGGGP